MPQDHPADLSDRELEVLELVAQDMPTKQIARHLHMGETTVKTHIGAMLRKTGARSRVGLALFHARQVGSLGQATFRSIG